MSRVIGQPVAVVTHRDGTPFLVNGQEVLHVHETYREWIGALVGQGEVDVWRVETHSSLMELHYHLATTTWTLAREED